MSKPFRITVLRSGNPPPSPRDVNKELQWFCTSLGLVGNRDKNHSQFRIFITLLKARKANVLLTTDNLADETELSRATVIHHLTKLEAAGFVQAEHERYRLAAENLQALVQHLRAEMEASIKELDEISARIDERLGLQK